MSIINLLTFIVVALMAFILVKGIIYRLLAIILPAASVKITYIDKEGSKREQIVSLNDDDDLIEKLRVIQSESKKKGRAS
ncbi:MAG: hypothetical protein WBH20_15960 [Oceanisphaera sp.]|uniref:hypothetical protein n=1 Tax=Oceanisphaera sp. TaxID=1929979 RepID=UPI003C73709B